jgi:hypothetical protein
VVPVIGGLGVIALIALFTWAMAGLIASGDAESTERLAPSTFRVGSVERVANEIADAGPLLFSPPGLNTADGERSIVLDHEGDDPTRGWVMYFAHPADRDASCPVEQIRGTDRFVDCDGRELGTSELSPPDPGMRPLVENRQTLILDVRGVTADEPPAGLTGS